MSIIIRNSIRAAERTLCAINRSNGTQSETIKPAVRSPEMYNENPDSPKSRGYKYEYLFFKKLIRPRRELFKITPYFISRLI